MPVLIFRPLFPIVVLACCASAVLSACQKSPEATLSTARDELRDAKADGAQLYADSTFREAEDALKAGWLEMAKQNGRFAPLRDYRVADSLLRTAILSARDARRQATVRRRQLQSRVQDEQQLLHDELDEWEQALSGSLARTRLLHHYHAAELALTAGERLANRARYPEALQCYSEAREALVNLSTELNRYATVDSDKITLWRSWVQQTVEESRIRGTAAIIVDKSAHKAYLVQSGKRVRTFPCDLGYNSARQKLFAGDAATPEGQYRVTDVKTIGSKYYKALLLDYPNARDRSRFKANKDNGVISTKSRIGGLIEIHGEGGRAQDWTEGCVAIADSDIDTLMRYATVGTPVTIVRRSDRWP